MVYGSDPRDANSNPHNQPQLNVYPSLVTVWALPGQPPAQQLLRCGTRPWWPVIYDQQRCALVVPRRRLTPVRADQYPCCFDYGAGTTGDFIGHLLVNGGTA
jgi:hypothetical protein